VSVFDAPAPPHGGEGDANDGQHDDQRKSKEDVPVAAHPIADGGHVLAPQALLIGSLDADNTHGDLHKGVEAVGKGGHG
jgi:hypothetical protein